MKPILIAIVILLVILLTIAFKLFLKARNIANSGPREFTDAVELMSFIRCVYECNIESQVVMYGFVKDAYVSEEAIISEGGPYLEVIVALITRNGHMEVPTICGSAEETLKKGDFVAVMPFHNKRHDLWFYTTVAKLKPYYLGKGKGFQIEKSFTT
ncbi:hypothetical protein [Acinetobacter baumannii]|uniref:hypothetical protein n=1 Tax=Acinetobacter baumannii TaxID=470 RepID=UPI0004F5467D|nr:hypothetical protein [Acinetobacter baumannii]TPS34085.1 hypothetical protein FJV04_18430 [Acinetobacter baumannii]